MASGGGSLEILTSTYKQVIDDVVRNMREEYLNDGADTEMLEQLKTLWLTKLSQSGAVSRPARAEPPPRPTHTQLPELANVVAPSKSMSSSTATGSSPASHGQHQHRVSTVASVGKTMSPSRPPPALLHVPTTAESSSATPPQPHAESVASGVIQKAPPRTAQQTTPTTSADSAQIAATSAQVAATPLTVPATPPVMFHPGMLAAAAALQQQANQSASSNAPGSSVLTSSAVPSVMEALQQQIALGGGASPAGSANATAAVNPFGALNLMNPAATGMVPIQTAQGTMLIPLQAFMALNQLKQAQQQQQQLAAAAASISGGGANSPDGTAAATNQRSGRGEKEVHQVDGLPPNLAAGSLRRQLERDGDDSERNSETDLFKSGLLADMKRSGEQLNTLLEPSESLGCSKHKSGRGSMPTESHKGFGPSANSQQEPMACSHFYHHDDHHGSDGEFIIQLDGAISGQSSKVIVQLDGGGGGAGDGSSSDDDSDADEDSSEDDDDGIGGAIDDNDEDPLNSEDDISDGNSDDGGRDFETEDTIVCQWEKVYRVKNKWKFQLKDGVMHVGGCDYVFHKTNGEADW